MISNRFDVKSACEIIRRYNFKIITMQFPDELSSECVDLYEAFNNELNNSSSNDAVYTLFVALDSTYGSSIDDVSAMHVNSDLIIYFGSDLSNSGTVPVIILPEIKAIDVQLCVSKLCPSIQSIVSKSATQASLTLFYDPSYFHQMHELQNVLNIEMSKSCADIACKISIAELPSCADLNNWNGKSSAKASHCIIGGLLINNKSLFYNQQQDDEEEEKETNQNIIIYIGDKAEQIQSISLHLSNILMVCYQTSTNEITLIRGDNSSVFTQRSGGMLKVKDASTIGIIVGSMGLTESSTQLILTRLQTLIQASGRKHYTFAMGRLNEAKLSNFPEIDLFCLISNDEHSMIPPKYVLVFSL